VQVTAELPGLEEKDIQVELEKAVLAIRGEKKTETEDKDRLFSERYYGRFERRIPLDDIDQDKIEAWFKNGVLNVILPKPLTAQHKGETDCDQRQIKPQGGVFSCSALSGQTNKANQAGAVVDSLERFPNVYCPVCKRTRPWFFYVLKGNAYLDHDCADIVCRECKTVLTEFAYKPESVPGHSECQRLRKSSHES
jgi:Hsp20/alpha crystallin family protein